jgi:sugar lactone lactonase YvrE
MKPLFLVVVALSCLAAYDTQAQFPNFPAADRVLGTADFTTAGSTTATPSTMNFAPGVTVDPVSGKLFVSSNSLHRVMRFGAAASLANGASAETVFGQLNFSGESAGSTATSLNNNYGIHVDRSGRLWVADYGNNRVLMFQGASVLPGFGSTPDRVFGQPNLTTVTAGTSAIKMSGPNSVWVDAADNLWVSDSVNSRILKFAAVSSLASGAAATRVLGQPDFTTNTHGTTAQKFYGLLGVTVDGAGRLWVTDANNNRVLRFDDAATLGNGAAASGVLGQPGFVTFNTGTTAQSINTPTGVVVDGTGTLYLAEYFNHRVLIFKNAAAKANGAAADGVIGQPDFTTNTGARSERNLAAPHGLALDEAGRLWVADTNNRRILRFSPDTSAAVPAVGRVPKTTGSTKLSIKGTASDTSGVAQVRYRVGKGAFKNAVGTTAWKLSAKLKLGKNTIEIVAVDALGNVSPPKKVKVTRQ